MTEPVAGAAFWAEGEAITGWCWCAAQPGTAGMVELLADGARIGAALANRRADGIRANGPPHERFGFLFLLEPDRRARTCRFELVEQRTGVCFARLRGQGPDHTAEDWLRRAAWVTRQAAELVMPEPPVAAVAAGFGFAGRGLLAEGLGLVRLPWCARPALSLIMTGGTDVIPLWEMLRQLAIAIAERPVELLVVARLDDAAAAALMGCARGLRLLNHGSIAEALSLARGDEVAMIDGAQPVDWPGLMAMLTAAHVAAGDEESPASKRFARGSC